MNDDVRHARAVRTLLDLVDGPPADRHAKKLIILADVRAMCIRDFGHLPEWWIELRDEVEAGRL